MSFKLGENEMLFEHDNFTMTKQSIHWPISPRDIKILGLVSSGASLTSWVEGVSLALVGHPSSDVVSIKIPYGVDALHQPAVHPIFFYWVG